MLVIENNERAKENNEISSPINDIAPGATLGPSASTPRVTANMPIVCLIECPYSDSDIRYKVTQSLNPNDRCSNGRR